MTVIAKNQYVTVISNFSVNPGDQDRLLNHLVDAFTCVHPDRVQVVQHGPDGNTC